MSHERGLIWPAAQWPAGPGSADVLRLDEAYFGPLLDYAAEDRYLRAHPG
jgi:hypothetical protein